MKLFYVDLFCGAGGTSTGVNSAQVDGEFCAEVIACVNHDKNAIASHAANHPDAMHFTEDIRTLELSPLVAHVNRCREKNPDSLVVLWASLECTNFSKAKGGMPRDADSRTLAEHLFRYIEAVNPEYIQIENVEEFMSWGDVDDKGKPISRDKGRCYMRWVNKVRSYGYDFDYRILNAADYGAYTSRKRFFGIFAKAGYPICFPRQTHSRMAGKQSRSLFEEDLKPWQPVREVLDFDDEGDSIFGRKKPLVEATLERIYAGLIKFVAGGNDAFLVKWNSMNRNGKYQAPGVDEPCPVVATQNRLGMAKVSFLSKQFSGHPGSKNLSIEQPAGAITCKDHHAFISAYYGSGGNHSVDDPNPTVTTKDRFALVESHFLDMQYGNGTPSSIDAPAPTVTTNPKHQLISCKPWIMSTNFKNIGSSIDEPSQVITANRKWHYLMNPQFKSKGGSIDDPCFTLIARMDKMPPYLMSVETEGVLPSFIVPTTDGYVYCIYDDDSEMMKRIKEFMALYGIVDVTMRMLKIPELKRIMGFPEDYVLVGTQAEQKKYIGNAVEVTVARRWCEALYSAVRDYLRKVA